MQKSAEKSQKLKEANKQQNFNTGIKDFDFWLSEVILGALPPGASEVILGALPPGVSEVTLWRPSPQGASEVTLWRPSPQGASEVTLGLPSPQGVP